jgi:hypothetical protein
LVVNIGSGDGNYNLPNLGILLKTVCEKTKVYLFLANNTSALKKVEYRQKSELKANLSWY